MATEKRDIAAFDELITHRPEIQAFDQELEGGYLMGQWHAERTFLQKEPQPTGVPYLWKWPFMEEMLTKAASSMDALTLARRALMFINPSFAPRGGTTLTLRVGMQLIRQGEVAWAHQHTPQALRFVVEGSKDAYTGVNGEQIPFLDNDLILTPMWSWHHHESNAKDRVIWIDAVDTPFVMSLNCLFSEEYPEAKFERKKAHSQCGGCPGNDSPERSDPGREQAVHRVSNGLPLGGYQGSLGATGGRSGRCQRWSRAQLHQSGDGRSDTADHGLRCPYASQGRENSQRTEDLGDLSLRDFGRRNDGGGRGATSLGPTGRIRGA